MLTFEKCISNKLLYILRSENIESLLIFKTIIIQSFKMFNRLFNDININQSLCSSTYLTLTYVLRNCITYVKFCINNQF